MCNEGLSEGCGMLRTYRELRNDGYPRWEARVIVRKSIAQLREFHLLNQLYPSAPE